MSLIPGRFAKLLVTKESRVFYEDGETRIGSLRPGTYWGIIQRDKSLKIFLNGMPHRINVKELLGGTTAKIKVVVPEEKFFIFCGTSFLCLNDGNIFKGDYCFGEQEGEDMVLSLNGNCLGTISAIRLFQAKVTIKPFNRQSPTD